MLVRVLFKNYLSYYEGTEFNMLPNLKRTRLTNHIYKNFSLPVLKISAIYGANGAGKSNILKGLDILQDFILNKDYIKEDNIYNNYRFLLTEENKNLPVSIGIEFINQEKVFYYHVDIKENLISKEELFIHNTERGEDIPIFVATHSNKTKILKVYDENGLEQQDYVDTKVVALLEKNHLSSIFSLQKDFPIVPNKNVEIAYEWFDEKLHILPSDFNIPIIIDYMDKMVSLRNFVNEIVGKMAVGIDAIEVKTQRLMDVFSNEIESNSEIREKILNKLKDSDPKTMIIKKKRNRPVLSICKERGEDVVKELVFKQEGINGYVADMDIDSQSEGTISLLSKLPILFKLIKKDQVFLIDELECSLHPQLIKRFLELFLEKRTSKGQLIFTTHEVHLLNQKLLRADEVWFTQKTNGISKIYSLNDFKEHNTIDIEKGYLAGRYGAIPFMGDKELLNEK